MSGSEKVEHPGHEALQGAERLVWAEDPLRVEGRAQRIDAALRAWLASMSDSPLSRSTEAWNHVSSALPALRDAIMREI